MFSIATYFVMDPRFFFFFFAFLWVFISSFICLFYLDARLPLMYRTSSKAIERSIRWFSSLGCYLVQCVFVCFIF